MQCQSCVERGFNPPNEAETSWQDMQVCMECYLPLAQNVIGIPKIIEIAPELQEETPKKESQESQESSKELQDPKLKLAYTEILSLPESLQFQEPSEVLSHRGDIYNYHAKSIASMNLDDITKFRETLRLILWNIQIAEEPLADYINKAKAEERQRQGIAGIAQSTEVLKKASKKAEKKSSEDVIQKLARLKGVTITADALEQAHDKAKAKQLNMTLEEYQVFKKETEEKKIKHQLGVFKRD